MKYIIPPILIILGWSWLISATSIYAFWQVLFTIVTFIVTSGILIFMSNKMMYDYEYNFNCRLHNGKEENLENLFYKLRLAQFRLNRAKSNMASCALDLQRFKDELLENEKILTDIIKESKGGLK